MIEPEIEKEPLYELSRAPRRRKENRLGARDRQLLFLLKSLFQESLCHRPVHIIRSVSVPFHHPEKHAANNMV
jgi:hypothetical protein